MIPQEVYHQNRHEPRVFSVSPRSLGALLREPPFLLLRAPHRLLQQLAQLRRGAPARQGPGGRAGLGLGVVGAVPHHDDEREDFVCRRARKRLAVGLGRVERGTEEVGLRVDGAGRTRRRLAENGERTVVEVVGRELVLNKMRERMKNTEEIGGNGVLEGGRRNRRNRGNRGNRGMGDGRDAVLAVAFEKGEHGAEGAEDGVLRGEEGVEKASTKSWVVFADHWT